MKENLNGDTVLKNYWGDNEHFADFFNAVLFQGLVLINPENLQDIDTDESVILEHKEKAESIKAARDVIKICKRIGNLELELIMAGIENQEHVHYAMPLRVMGYDYGTYRKQYEDNARKYKKISQGMTEDEYLSRMRKTDRFIPVVTFVLYYGEKPWDGALSLKGMLNIPESVRPFVNDYKMNLIEARKNNLVLHNIENRDLFHLFGILLDQNSQTRTRKESAINYVEQNKVDNSVIMAVAGATNGKINYSEIKQKGETNMISVFQETWDEGKSEGKIEGKAEGIIETGTELGLSKDDILTRLQNKLNISIQKAQEYMERFGKQMA